MTFAFMLFAFLAIISVQKYNINLRLANYSYFIFVLLPMMDKLTPQQRHKNMASIHSTNTKPEVLVRKYLWRQGFRYRLNDPRLPGHPDLVLRRYRTCVFVNGCFWHGHEGCKHFCLPKTNTVFWEKKINRNRERDKEEQKRLAEMGWHVIVVWECELKSDKREKTLTSLVFTLNHIYLQDHSVPYRPIEQDDDIPLAAEPLGDNGFRG